MAIETNRADIIMNSKTEWNQSRLPRIVIESGEELMEDVESGLNRNRDRETERRQLKIPKSIVQKRVNETGDEEETWEKYKKRKIEECQRTAIRVENRLRKGGRRREDGDPLKEVGSLGGEEGRLEEWRRVYEIKDKKSNENTDQSTVKQNPEKVFIEKYSELFPL